MREAPAENNLARLSRGQVAFWKNLGKKLLLSTGSLLFCLVVLECVFLVQAGYNQNANNQERGFFVNRVCFEPDLISGYRWLPGKTRTVRLHKGEVLYDNEFVANAQGYMSRHDFRHTKTPGSKRVAAFGDSFTAMVQIESPWPEQLERRLNSKAKVNCECYNFGINGAGLQNWNSIFFKELVPNYEFDAVIFAVFMENLSRPFSMACCKDGGTYFGRFPAPPQSFQEFETSYLPKMARGYEIVGDTELTQRIADHTRWQWPGLKCRAPQGLSNIIKGVKTRLENRSWLKARRKWKLSSRTPPLYQKPIWRAFTARMWSEGCTPCWIIAKTKVCRSCYAPFLPVKAPWSSAESKDRERI